MSLRFVLRYGAQPTIRRLCVRRLRWSRRRALRRVRRDRGSGSGIRMIVNRTNSLDERIEVVACHNGERYSFLFDCHPRNREKTIEIAARWALNPELNFTLGDARTVIEQIEMTYR